MVSKMCNEGKGSGKCLTPKTLSSLSKVGIRNCHSFSFHPETIGNTSRKDLMARLRDERALAVSLSLQNPHLHT